MNTIKPLLCRNRKPLPRLDLLHNFSIHTGLLLLFLCVVSLTLSAEGQQSTEDPALAPNGAETQTTPQNTETSSEGTDGTSANSDGSATEPTKETITGTSKRMERYEKDGITILIDEAKTVRHNEQGIEIGFLNADKITLKSDLETGTTTEVIAVGNVEIRDQDIFATCDHAIMNNLTNTVVLKENVVVLQNKDRLETKLFTFNRTTGKQTGEGGVKFKVTVTQAAPVAAETEGEAADPATTESEATENEVQQDGNADADAEESSDADTDSAEVTDREEDIDGSDGEASEAQSEETENTD